MSVAKSYAQALFELTAEKAQGAPDALRVEEELAALAATIQGHPELSQLMSGAVVSSEQCGGIVGAIAERLGLSVIVTRAAKIAAEKGRTGLFSQIHDEFVRLRVGAEGGVLGELVSAEAMETRDQEELAQAFGKKLGKKVIFKTRVDPALIAGVQVTVSGVTYDGSVRAQLQRAKSAFAAAAGQA
jgi:F-type H+-transporting ATPase subunit delta